LLRAVALGDETILQNLRRICAPECLIEIVIGVDEERDKSEIERLELPKLSTVYLENVLIPSYQAAGFKILESGILTAADWSKLETSWARKLQGNESRRVTYLILQAS
jgi:hypothetical protein